MMDACGAEFMHLMKTGAILNLFTYDENIDDYHDEVITWSDEGFLSDRGGRLLDADTLLLYMDDDKCDCIEVIHEGEMKIRICSLP